MESSGLCVDCKNIKKGGRGAREEGGAREEREEGKCNLSGLVMYSV